LFLVILAAAPVLVAAALRAAATPNATFTFNGRSPTDVEVFGAIVWLAFVRFIIPVAGVFYGTALIADEIDQKTITYLFARPVPRRAVLLGKYLAYLVCTFAVVLPAVALTFLLLLPTGSGTLGAAVSALAADLVALGLGLAAYGAVFAFVGVRVKRPLVTGLVLTLGWEPAAMLFPGYLKRLTLAYYLQALVKHDGPSDSALAAIMQIFYEVPAASTGAGVLILVTVAALYLASRTIERREYVLEQ
jgi:ABC-type transport system involved in multi-copper enzyme maturation permease subunit